MLDSNFRLFFSDSTAPCPHTHTAPPKGDCRHPSWATTSRLNFAGTHTAPQNHKGSRFVCGVLYVLHTRTQLYTYCCAHLLTKDRSGLLHLHNCSTCDLIWEDVRVFVSSFESVTCVTKTPWGKWKIPVNRAKLYNTSIIRTWRREWPCARWLYTTVVYCCLFNQSPRTQTYIIYIHILYKYTRVCHIILPSAVLGTHKFTSRNIYIDMFRGWGFRSTRVACRLTPQLNCCLTWAVARLRRMIRATSGRLGYAKFCRSTSLYTSHET